MKRLSILLALLSLIAIDPANAQLFQARLVTSAYSWQRLDAAQQAESHLFAYQSAQFTLGSKNITFRTSMQGFNDFAGPNKNDPSFRLYNFSVKVRDILDMVDLQAGRFFVFSGAGLGLIDGASAKITPEWYGLSLTGFYGILAPGDRSVELNDAENSLMGVHLAGQPIPSLQVSVSLAMKQYSPKGYKSIRADTLFNPYTVDFRPTARAEEIVSADARYDIEGYGDVYARYDHDIGTGEMARVNAFGRFRVMDALAVTAEYLQREPRVSYQSIFSVFSLSTVKDISAGVEYGLTESWNLIANVGSISYGSESAQRLTLGVNGEYVSASFSKNMSDRNDLNSASLNAGYPLMDNLLTPTLLVSYAHYKLDESAPTNTAIGVAGGVVVRPMDLLTVDTQVQWMNNKVYASDVRFFLRVSYTLSSRLNLF